MEFEDGATMPNVGFDGSDVRHLYAEKRAGTQQRLGQCGPDRAATRLDGSVPEQETTCDDQNSDETYCPLD